MTIYAKSRVVDTEGSQPTEVSMYVPQTKPSCRPARRAELLLATTLRKLLTAFPLSAEHPEPASEASRVASSLAG
jgi:hypothetical protein